MTTIDERTLARAAERASRALLTVYEKGFDKLSDRERDAIGVVRFACDEIEGGDR